MSQSYIRHHTLHFFAAYDCGETPPWVPAVRSFFRFRDPYPPGKDTDHCETAGWIESVVTVHYGTRVVIEVYINPRNPDPSAWSE